MRRTIKKTMAILLAAVLAFSVLTVGVVSASAEDTNMAVTVSSSVPEFFPTSTLNVDRTAGKMTVTYWFNFQDYMMVNNQWQLSYDPNVLRYNSDDGVNQTVKNNKTTYLVYRFPDSELGSMEFNPYCEQEGVMKGNITKAEGFDCYNEGKLPFLSITFDIIGTSAAFTTVNLDLQVLQVRHKDADPSSTPVDFINHSEIVDDNVTFTADESYTAAYEGDFNADFSEGPVHLDDFKFDNYNVSLESSIALQLFITSEKLSGYDSFYLAITAPGKNDAVVYPEPNLDSRNRYVFRYLNLYPQDMDKEVTCVLHAFKDGTEYYGDGRVVCVCDYLYNIYGISSKYDTLITDMFNYGAATQKFRDHNATSLMNDRLTDVQRGYATGDVTCQDLRDKHYQVNPNTTAEWGNGSAELNSAIYSNIKFTDTTGVSGKYVIAKIGKREYRIDEFTSLGNNTYSFTFKDGYAHELAKPVYFTLYNEDGTAVSDVYRYDIESYAAALLNMNIDSYTRELVIAMVKYGRAAAALSA